MLNERPETNDQSFARRQIFFQSHPGAWPSVQIAAVHGGIGRCGRSGAVYSGSLRLRNRPRHGIDHDFKPLLPSSGIRLRTCPLLCRQEKRRNRRATARALGSDLLGLPNRIANAGIVSDEIDPTRPPSGPRRAPRRGTNGWRCFPHHSSSFPAKKIGCLRYITKPV